MLGTGNARPTSGGCRVLVTSRRAHWSPTLGVTALPLDLLPRSDSIELRRRYRPDLPAEKPGSTRSPTGWAICTSRSTWQGDTLLAYRAEVGLDDYLAEPDQPALIGHASLLGEGLEDSPSPTHHVPGHQPPTRLASPAAAASTARAASATSPSTTAQPCDRTVRDGWTKA